MDISDSDEDGPVHLMQNLARNVRELLDVPANYQVRRILPQPILCEIYGVWKFKIQNIISIN